jgi:hypothetical protein
MLVHGRACTSSPHEVDMASAVAASHVATGTTRRRFASNGGISECFVKRSLSVPTAFGSAAWTAEGGEPWMASVTFLLGRKAPVVRVVEDGVRWAPMGFPFPLILFVEALPRRTAHREMD